MSDPKRIMADTYLEALEAAGIITRKDLIRRVVIDAEVRNPLRLYVERYGDERMLAVDMTADGIEIHGVPA